MTELNEGASPVSADPWRRLMSFVYELVILFGVMWFVWYVYSSVFRFQAQRASDQGFLAYQVFTFVVLGGYFTWFWAFGRRTLPMKTMSLDLVDRANRKLDIPRALGRYLIGLGIILAVLAIGKYVHKALLLLVLLPFIWCFFDVQRRSLIDVLAGTRLIFRDARKG